MAPLPRDLPDADRDPLVAAARAFLFEQPLPASAHAAAAADWESTVVHAEHERMAPLLYVLLRGGGGPAWVVSRLRTAWVAAERQSLLAGEQLREAVRALGDAGIPALVLKGPALAAVYYPDPALRPFTDLDVLVRRRDRDRALDLLCAMGYVHGSPGRSRAYELAHAAAVYLVAPDDRFRLPIDLHWECIAHPGGARATEHLADDLWSRVVPAPSWGETAYALSAEDLVVYLAAHFAIHHTLAGDLWRLDLARVLQRHGATLDWDAIADRARRWGAARAVYFALRSVAQHLGAAVPETTLSRLWPGRLRITLVERLQRAGAERLRRLEYVVGLAMLDRRSDIARTLAAGLVPHPAWVRSRYESRSLPVAYAAHYARVVSIAMRAVGVR